MSLSAMQQQQVESLMPDAEAMGRAYGKGDEEYVSEAYLALCQAVKDYDATQRVSLETYCTLMVRDRLLHFKEKETTKHKHGLAGGFPDRFDPAQPQQREPKMTPEQFESILAILPVRCRDVARLHWLDHRKVYEIQCATGLSRRSVFTRLRDAKIYALFFLASSGVPTRKQLADLRKAA